MRRATASAACLVLLVGLVAGCSNAEVDASELGEWMSAQEHPVEDGLGQMSSRVSPDDPPAEPGSGIAMNFAAPTPVGGVRLSCFGDDTLTFFVEVVYEEGNGISGTGTEHEVACADGAYTADVDSPPVDAVRVDAYGADHHGAWHAVILEE